jgi:hypothetical protein
MLFLALPSSAVLKPTQAGLVLVCIVYCNDQFISTSLQKKCIFLNCPRNYHYANTLLALLYSAQILFLYFSLVLVTVTWCENS